MMVDTQLFKNFPTRSVVTLAVPLVVCALAVGALFYGLNATQARLDSVNDRLQAHAELSKFVQAAKNRQTLLTNLMQRKEAVAQPATIPALLTELRTLAVKSGLPNAQFMPQAISMIDSPTIRITGKASGSSENFRRFIVTLSHQSWIHEFEFFEARYGEPEDSFEIRMRASFSGAKNAKEGSK